MTNRALVFVYGILAYVAFLVAFPSFIGFIGGFAVPTTLDSPSRGPLGTALAIDAALLGLFAVQHSVMARKWFKDAWTRIVPAPAERSTYVLFSSLALALLVWQWRPIGGIVWSVEDAAGRLVLRGLFACGLLLVLLCTFVINHADQLGLRQISLHLTGKPYPAARFATPGPYKLVRHPLHVGWLLTFWMTPTMTAAHLVFAIATTAYILTAIQLKERDLVRVHGNDYLAYRSRVPMLLPFRRRRSDEPHLTSTVTL